MKRRTVIILACLVIAAISTEVYPQARGAAGQASQPQMAPKIVPGSTAEMQSAKFWISRIKNPDKVIMTPDQIKALNEKNKTRGSNFTDIFGNPYSIDNTLASQERIGIMYHVEDPLTYTSFPSDSLKFRIERQNQWLRESAIADRRGLPFDEDMKKELLDNTDVESIPSGSVRPQYGIIVEHTLGRLMPYELPTGRGSGSFLMDSMQAGLVDYGQPVAVLHMSKDRRWAYIRSEISFVWAEARHIALGTPKEIRAYIDSPSFIVATTHKIPIYGDSNFRNYITDFYLGAKVKLLEKTTAGYRVSYPVRTPEGSFSTATGWVKSDASVSVGYQPFTQRNILNTFFSLLYRPYSGRDSFNERDCCGTMRTVFRTFGFHMGRWTSHQLHASDHVYMFPRDTPKEKKYELLKGCEPGICLVGDGGHISMYIGQADGRYFVIHQSGYSYNDENGVRLSVARVNVNDTELAGGSNVSQWTEITTIKP